MKQFKTRFLVIILLIYASGMSFFLVHSMSYEYSFFSEDTKKESNWKLVPIYDVFLDIEQDYNKEISIVISTRDLYKCGDIYYNTDIKDNIINISLQNIILKRKCNKYLNNPSVIEKIPAIMYEKGESIILKISSNQGTNSYLFSFVDGYLNISDSIQSQDDNADINVKTNSFSRFTKNKYVLITDDIVRIRGDYFSNKGKKMFEDLMSNIKGEAVDINESDVAIKDMLDSSFDTDAYIDIKYFKIPNNNEYLKKLMMDNKENDCYLEKIDQSKCLSLDIRTANGYRYCTWLDVKY
ncbi:MAG: hypothetical protein PHZ07_01970 [Patescibacteria group bacterium]|nr:hypothetical protein [Patescibacteria group bacterium]MDD4304047.1 hypothetical protein [Patescibacteria group bacterium]MDD4694924.1 hypothetical protein [Patescibacteria group bacterium]